MFETNPSVIQDGATAPTPLVLIHDGGGTTYSYYLLDDLGRVLLGIANPRFETGPVWEGGLREMATLYASMVAERIGAGRVILGGWSLGGMLALETAHILFEQYPGTEVAGLVLIDSMCPVPPPGGWGPAASRVASYRIEWPETTQAKTRAAVQRCFDEAHKMADGWKPPAAWAASATSASGPPRAVLLRSRDPVPVPDDEILFVDLHRHEDRLGWDNYRRDMFCRVLEIPGHHFSVFAMEHLETVSQMIRIACQIVEGNE